MNMDLDLQGIFEDNNTYDYDQDYNYNDECNTELSSRFMLIFVPVIYSVVLLLGLLGNGLVVAALWKKKRSLNLTSVFVLHLSLADLLLLLTIPLWATDAVKGWSFSNTAFCKLAGVVFTVNFCCCNLLLLCMSLNHYLCLIHSLQKFSCKNLSWLHLISLPAWCFSILLSIPDMIYLQSTTRSKGGDNVECLHINPRSDSSRLASRLLYHILGFLLPTAVVLYCWLRVLLLLVFGCNTLQKQNAIHKRRSTFFLLVLVLTFVIFWLPYNITLLVDTVKPVTTVKGACKEDRWNAVKITAIFGFLHTCLNPLIYLGFSGEFRRWVSNVMKCSGYELDEDLFPWDVKVTKTVKCPQEEKVSLQIQSVPIQQENRSLVGT